MSDERLTYSAKLALLTGVARDARLCRSDVAVATVLIDHANLKTGACYPSVSTIVKESGVPKTTALRALRKLMEAGWIKADKRNGAVTHYTLQTGATTGTGSEGGTGAISNLLRGQTGATTGTEAVPLPEPEQKRKAKATRKSARARKTDSVTLPTWLPADAWQAWKDHRKQVGRKFTEHAQVLGIQNLEKLRSEGHDPRKLIELAIESSWSSFYPRESTKANGAVGRIERDTRTDDELAAANEAELARFGFGDAA